MSGNGRLTRYCTRPVLCNSEAQITHRISLERRIGSFDQDRTLWPVVRFRTASPEMSDYTFSTLAPNEFEDLSKDLLERHLGVQLQAFTTGRDGGIDLRHAPAKGESWVVQCKHYAGSQFADLKRSVSKEVEKLH